LRPDNRRQTADPETFLPDHGEFGLVQILLTARRGLFQIPEEIIATIEPATDPGAHIQMHAAATLGTEPGIEAHDAGDLRR